MRPTTPRLKKAAPASLRRDCSSRPGKNSFANPNGVEKRRNAGNSACTPAKWSESGKKDGNGMYCILVPQRMVGIRKKGWNRYSCTSANELLLVQVHVQTSRKTTHRTQHKHASYRVQSTTNTASTMAIPQMFVSQRGRRCWNCHQPSGLCLKSRWLCHSLSQASQRIRFAEGLVLQARLCLLKSTTASKGDWASKACDTHLSRWNQCG